MRCLRSLLLPLFLLVAAGLPARAQGTRIKDLPLTTTIPADGRIALDASTFTALRGISVQQLATNLGTLAVADKLNTTNGVAVGLNTPTTATTANAVVNKATMDAALATANAAGGATNVASPWVLARYLGLTTIKTVGDSHTIGQLAAGPLQFTDSSSRLLSDYRYADQLAATNGLTLSNYAVSGSSQMFPQISSGPAQSHLNQIGHYLDAPTWSGVVTTLGGFNDALPTMSGDAWVRASRLANSAMLARLLFTNYVNLSNGRTATGGTNSTWSTTGTALSGGSNAANNPFPWGDTAANDRDVLTIKSGQRLAITPTAGTTVLVYELTADGGGASVWVNGTNVVNIDTTLPSPATTQRMPAALLIPYGSAAITITNTSGTNYLMALGQLPAPSDCTNRVIILGAPVQLSTSVRSASLAKSIGDAVWGAAVQFADYAVYFADPNALIDPVVDVIGSSDPNHFNPSGQRKIFRAFMNAVRVSQSPRRNAFAGSMGEQVYINGTSSGTMSLGFARQGTNRVEFTINSSGDLVASMIDAANNSIGTAFNVSNSDRGFVAETYIRSKQGSAFSGGNVYAPATDYMSLASTGGSGYLLSLAGGTLGTTRPLVVYAAGISYANAGTATSFTSSGLTDVGSITSAGIKSSVAGAFGGANSSPPAFDYMALASTGGSGYLLSLAANSTGTTRPLIIYANGVSYANAGTITSATFSNPNLGNATATTLTASGGLTSVGIKSSAAGAFGGANNSAAAFDYMALASTSGSGYLLSLASNSLSTTRPLVVYAAGVSYSNAGTATGLTTSGLTDVGVVTAAGVKSSLPGVFGGATSFVPTFDYVSLASTAGTGYLLSLAANSTSTTRPLAVYAAGVSYTNAGTATGLTTSGLTDVGVITVAGVKSSLPGVFGGATSFVPAFDYVSLASTGGTGYLLSLAANSTNTTRPLSIYAAGVSYANAGTATGLITSGLTDVGVITVAGVKSSLPGVFGGATSFVPDFDYVSLSSTGGRGYLLSLAANSTSTTRPLIVYANGISFANAGVVSNAVFDAPALGTPSSAVLTSATGLPISTGVAGLGTGVATALAVNIGSAGAPVVNGGALGTPSSGTLTSATGLPISTGVAGLGTGIATALATPSSANLASAITDETGSGGGFVRADGATVTNMVFGVNGSAQKAAGFDSSGNLSFYNVTKTELERVAGVTSAIQTQLDGKEPTITTLAATKGGTAQSSYTTGDMLYASAANTLSKRSIGTNGQVWTVVSGVPNWATPASASGITNLTTSTTYYVSGQDPSLYSIVLEPPGSIGGLKTQVLPDKSGDVQVDDGVNGLSISALKVDGNGIKINRIRHGLATLVGGTVTVSDAYVSTSTRIMLSSQGGGTTPGILRVNTRSAATSFTITSSVVTDTDIVAWVAIEP